MTTEKNLPPSYDVFYQENDWILEAMDAANTGLWVITVDTRTGQSAMLANPVMVRLLGADSEDHLLSPEECFTYWRSRIDKRYEAEVNEAVGQLVASSLMHEVRYLYNHPNGDIFVRCGGRRVSAENDPVIRITGYHQNVSELHAVHQSLRESLSRLSLACRLGQLGVFEIQYSDGELELAANDIFCGQFGLDELLLDEKSVLAVEECILPEDRPRWQALLKPAQWTPGHQEHTEVRINHPERGTCWLKLAYEVVGEDGNCRMAGYTDDVTEHRVHEQLLRKAAEAAEAANAAKSIFLANMSHEIRTPMNGIMGMAYLTLNSGLTPQQKDYVEKIHTTCESLLDIINDLLDFSKIEANHMELENLPFHPARELEAVLALIQTKAQSKGLNLESSIDPNLPHALVGDALRLRQILLNLGSNAVKFSDQGTVRVRLDLMPPLAQEGQAGHDEEAGTGKAKDTGQEVRLLCRVSDEGIGMRPEDLARIFTPFSQADSSITRRFGGTGLGLALCQRLAELMGGRISVQSELGKGSEFRVELPMSMAAEHEAPPLGDALEDNPEDLSCLEGLHVLVAEDGDINREIMEALLESMGAVCLPAVNGQEALDIWREQHARIDIILMDVQMPVMDGYTATGLIRQSGLARAQSVPIVAMTAYAMRGDAERSLDSGMDAHLTKPVNVDELRQTLKFFALRPEPPDNAA